MELLAIIIPAVSLAGSVVWAAYHVGREIGHMGSKLEAHATTVSDVAQTMGRMDHRVRDLERRVGTKAGG
jgi:hypothetical protein